MEIKESEKETELNDKQPGENSGSCPCAEDPFAAMPPELRPRPKNHSGDLRQVTCPGCGQVFWTNRNTDLCFDCEDKAKHLLDVTSSNELRPDSEKGAHMPAHIKPLGQLKKYIGDQTEIVVEPGRTIREILSSLSIPLEIVAGVIVNETLQTKDYCVQANDEIKLYSVVGGG